MDRGAEIAREMTLANRAARANQRVTTDVDPTFKEKVDRATAALADLAAFLLTSSQRPQRFQEASRVALLARQVSLAGATRVAEFGNHHDAYNIAAGAAAAEPPIFAGAGFQEPAIGAAVQGPWVGANMGANPYPVNEAGIERRNLALAVNPLLQSQAESARALTRKAQAEELDHLTRLRNELRAKPSTPEGVREHKILSQRIEKIYALLEADPDLRATPDPAPEKASTVRSLGKGHRPPKTRVKRG